MATKKSTSKSEAADKVSSTETELHQLRQIVFGAAQAGLEEQIHKLQQQMNGNFEQLTVQMEEQSKALNLTMQAGVKKLEDKIDQVEHQQQEKDAELNAYADRLASELEMAETSGKEGTDQLQDRLEREVARLTQLFTEQHDQAMRKLEQVATELSSSKTDRKTLAQLLATMASNLEIDELSDTE